MATRTLNKLRPYSAKSTNLSPGRYSDGGNLYLNVSIARTKSWVFMWTQDGKRREMGLGPYPTVSIEKARKKAEECRVHVQEGRDPIAERDKDVGKTFGQCCDEYIEAMKPSWKNEKHIAQWEMTLKHYCAPIRDKRVSIIDTADVLSVLQPIWLEKPETASRLRGRIERVLSYAKVKGYRTGENPAMWRDHLKNVLPGIPKHKKKHHPAMPYEAVPAFVQRLRAMEGMSAPALEFTILTAARSVETYAARWSEIDFAKAVWKVPGIRMKGGEGHEVPLCQRVVDILQPLYETRTSKYVFPGEKPGRHLSSAAMDALLTRMGEDAYTVHGFRSSFRDWVGEITNFPRDLAEIALAHKVGDETEQAYRRGSALLKRRKMMQAWAAYCERSRPANVVELSVARAQA